MACAASRSCYCRVFNFGLHSPNVAAVTPQQPTAGHVLTPAIELTMAAIIHSWFIVFFPLLFLLILWFDSSIFLFRSRNDFLRIGVAVIIVVVVLLLVMIFRFHFVSNWLNSGRSICEWVWGGRRGGGRSSVSLRGSKIPSLSNATSIRKLSRNWTPWSIPRIRKPVEILDASWGNPSKGNSQTPQTLQKLLKNPWSSVKHLRASLKNLKRKRNDSKFKSLLISNYN